MSNLDSGRARRARGAAVAVTALLLAASLSFAGVAAAAQSNSTGAYAFAYADSDSHVTLVTADGSAVDLGVSAEVVGSVSDVDGDGVVEVPYVTSDHGLYVVEPGGETTRLAGDARKDLTKVATGDLNGDGTKSVYYATESEDVAAVDVGSEPRDVGGLQGVAALGVVDYDGDGDRDLVYAADTNGPIQYYDGQNVDSTEYTSIGSNNGLGVGAPANFDHSGTPRVPVVDGAGDIVLVAADGTKTKIATDSVDKSPVAPVDWTGDDDLEVLHLRNGQVTATTLAGETVTVTADGNSLVAQQDAGVAAVVGSSDSGSDSTLDVRSFDAAAADDEVRVSVNASESLTGLRVSLSGPTDATLTRDDFTESGSHTYTATRAVADGSYTVSLERVESDDGDVRTDVASSDVVVDATGVTVSGATLTDATDGDSVVRPGDTVRVAADVSGDVETVRADLSAFDAGTVTLADSGDEYAATATVGQDVTEGDHAATVSATDGQGNHDATETGALSVSLSASDDSTDSGGSGSADDASGVEYAASVDPATDAPATVTTHTVTVTVDESIGSWNGLRVDYRGTGTDVSNVGQNDVVTLGIDRGDDAAGATVDQSVRADLSSVSGSADGAVLTIGLTGNAEVHAGDELVVVYRDVRNPTAGTYNVSVNANPQSGSAAATARLAVAAQSQASGGDSTQASGDVQTTATATTTTESEQSAESTRTSSATSPGFGVSAGALALLVAALFAARRVRR